MNAYWRNARSRTTPSRAWTWRCGTSWASRPDAAYPLVRRQVREGVPIYRHRPMAATSPSCATTSRAFASRESPHIRCQSGAMAAADSAPHPRVRRGRGPGVYLDARPYMRGTLKLFDDIRQPHRLRCRAVPRRCRAPEAGGRDPLRAEHGAFELFFLEDAIALEEGNGFASCAPRPARRWRRASCSIYPFEWRS